MKTITRLMSGLMATIFIASANALANSDSEPIYLAVTSPDHPDTWVAGANQKSDKLRWDSSRQMLVVDVKYSNQDYADNVHPVRTDEHSLTFPTVRLASNGSDLLASNRQGETARIGRVKDGFFGKEVVLSKGVDLKVHRRHGEIYATLIYNALMKDQTD